MMHESIERIIKGRRSIRYYLDRPVPREVLERILALAVWAPSAHNRQPWRFAVVTTPETRRELAQAMGKRLCADLSADGLPPEQIERDVGRSYHRIGGAPALILVCLSMVDMDHYPDTQRASAERIMAVQSVALAAQNLMLAAHAEGLSTCWLCAPLFCPDVPVATLHLPSDWQPQALITLGYPAVERQSTRHPLETRVVWR
jgi:coenzyme F420-0:L-glutamate ligase/coenzyme F420-1:gamma-L-glutamate ligase